MGIEIEKKFLIKTTKEFQELLKEVSPKRIIQGYLSNSNEVVTRVRVMSDEFNKSGYLTIKGKQEGISKSEYEYEIPYLDAIELFKMSNSKIEKTRYEIKIKNEKTYWEIDVFGGLNEGLIIAEIELPSEDYHIDIPSWIDKEVSKDFKYANNNLSKNPYINWK